MITVVAPPIAGGVRDYAKVIADATCSRLLALDRSIESGTLDGPRRGVLFVQVSHYGYQERGVPLKLLRWLRKQKKTGFRIGCYFHELFAFGPPWTSSFWLSPIQRFITAQMARLSDFWMTNRQASAQWLLHVGGKKPHAVLPVFSNVGEPAAYNASRSRSLVIFGSAGLRDCTYRQAGSALFDWAARHGLEVHDIGPRLDGDELRRELVRRRVTEHGPLANGAASRLLAEAMIGVVAYPIAVIAKSSVFAAYCAHGVCTMVISDACPTVDGLVEGAQYWDWARSERRCLTECNSIGRGAFDWYAGHAIAVHSEALVKLSHG
jgi:hypothetical protein